ncbi:hypothetical protein Y1Q_0010684 [Alligator mississippiensis]|uniref:Uncharacterized protein n=1 Tax=Alligator mississippiensis TaxID=8496 RepID=A0A151M6E7_ALLMI|nr:hypothetical protein Y1Q_0010684 [Alligator mississippiensis]
MQPAGPSSTIYLPVWRIWNFSRRIPRGSSSEDLELLLPKCILLLQHMKYYIDSSEILQRAYVILYLANLRAM